MTGRPVVMVVPGYASADDPDCVPALRGLVRKLARDWDITVVALRYPYHRRLYRFDGVEVLPLGGKFARGCERIRFIGSSVADIQKVVRNQTTFLLHAFWADEPGFVAAMVGRALGLPVVLSFAGGELADVPEAGYGGRREVLGPALVGTALHQASAVTVGSVHQREAVRAELTRLGVQATVDVAPLGVDLDRFRQDGPRRDLGPGRHVVAIAANAPVKGLSVLLQAWDLVAQTHPDATLHLVGARTADLGGNGRVVAHDHVPHVGLPSLLRACDLWVQASWHESQSVALFEAAACGLPVVGTRVGSLADFPGAIATCEPGSPDDLATAIDRGLRVGSAAVTAGTEQRRALGEDAAAARFSAIYERCLRRSKS